MGRAGDRSPPYCRSPSAGRDGWIGLGAEPDLARDVESRFDQETRTRPDETMKDKTQKDASAPDTASSLRWLADVAEPRLRSRRGVSVASAGREAGEDPRFACHAPVKVTSRRANDILRACGRDALPLDDPGVRRDLIKAVSGQKKSSVLCWWYRGRLVPILLTATTASLWRTT